MSGSELLWELSRPILLGFALGVVGSIPIFLYANRSWKKRREIYQQFEERADFKSEHRVRICSPERYRKWFKIFPWGGCGYISKNENGYTLEAFPHKTEAFKVEFSSDDVIDKGRLHWYRNGPLPWIFIDSPQGKSYVAAETGTLIFGIRKAYKLLREYLEVRS